MKNINRRNALAVTGAGLTAALTTALTVSPVLAGQSELESLIATYNAVRADYDKVYDEFAVAEREYVQWKETAPLSRDIRDRIARAFPGQGLETILTQGSCDPLRKECKAIASLPVVASYNRARSKEKVALYALIDAQCAVCGYPMHSMAEVRIKAAWLRDKYQGRSADFMDKEASALLQSFFDLDA